MGTQSEAAPESGVSSLFKGRDSGIEVGPVAFRSRVPGGKSRVPGANISPVPMTKFPEAPYGPGTLRHPVSSLGWEAGAGFLWPDSGVEWGRWVFCVEMPTGVDFSSAGVV